MTKKLTRGRRDAAGGVCRVVKPRRHHADSGGVITAPSTVLLVLPRHARPVLTQRRLPFLGPKDRRDGITRQARSRSAQARHRRGVHAVSERARMRGRPLQNAAVALQPDGCVFRARGLRPGGLQPEAPGPSAPPRALSAGVTMATGHAQEGYCDGCHQWFRMWSSPDVESEPECPVCAEPASIVTERAASTPA